MADLLILADGGGSIGFGHLMRCLEIKNTWNHGNARLLGYMEAGLSSPNGAVFFDWLSYPENLSKFSSGNSIVLVDSYRPNEDYFRLLKSLFKFVVVFDDYNRISYPVDLVICPGVYGKDIDYSSQTAISLGGEKYVIIRSEILSVKQTKTCNNIKSVLVTLGCVDYKLYQSVINLLESMSYQAIVVTGNEEAVKKIVANTSRIYGRLEPLAMAKIMASADLAIASSGQTLNELAYLGVPTFAIRTGIDQQGNWEYYGHHNLSLANALYNDKKLGSALKIALKNVTYKSRLEKSHRLQSLFTHKGAEEICELINKLESNLDE